MKQWMQRERMARRMIMMIAGILLLGIGVGLFKLSRMGNDPSTAMVIAIGDQVQVDFSLVLIVMNCLWFASEWIWERKLIGPGTFVNWFGVGPIASVSERLLRTYLGAPQEGAAQWGVMALGIVVLSFSCALYQTADLGIAPYDSLSIALSHRVKPRYFWCRIFTDSVCVLLALCLGGLIGWGTLVCAVGLGPFIAFFTRHAAEKMLSAGKK